MTGIFLNKFKECKQKNKPRRDVKCQLLARLQFCETQNLKKPARKYPRN